MKIVRATNSPPTPIYPLSGTLFFSLQNRCFLFRIFLFFPLSAFPSKTLFDFLSPTPSMTYFSRFVSSIRFNLWNWRIIEWCIASFTFFLSLSVSFFSSNMFLESLASRKLVSRIRHFIYREYRVASALHLCEIYYYGNEPHPLGWFMKSFCLSCQNFSTEENGRLERAG